ncbi:LOW QUALITY PROTEIN: protein yellow [Drosophila ficusphila]|uniref:LOW QUALITY PROTEIN: protein yellow n=1 Tax=Drosophila ficusphila TaxID=30025 RepID=UPI0007E7F6BC|nr:LOW QUALITY PROTEIN: protein yellow [Drosophila ficusphila]
MELSLCRFSAIMIAILLGLFCAVQGQKLALKDLHTLHQWTNLSLGDDLSKGNRFLPVDVDIEYGDEGRHRTFLTIPRLGMATPFTLATVVASDNEVVENPRLEAYPNGEWHVPPNNCSGITSAIRTYIDECWRLWVVDSGQVNSIQLCPPQILTFDLVKDELIQRHSIPPDAYTPSVSIFTALVVDLAESGTPNRCVGGIAYIADAWGYGLIVFDSLSGRSWRIEHESMKPLKLGRMGRSSNSQAGIFTVSLSPSEVEERFLYFHTLNAFNEVKVSLTLINNETLWRTSNASEVGEHFHVLGTRGIQCESEVMDQSGNLFCSLISLGAIIRWQESSNYTADDLRVVAYNPHKIKFVTGLKINRNSKGEEELWALSSQPKLFVGVDLPANEVKFQIIGCRTADLLANTPCTVGATEATPPNV